MVSGREEGAEWKASGSDRQGDATCFIQRLQRMPINVTTQITMMASKSQADDGAETSRGSTAAERLGSKLGGRILQHKSLIRHGGQHDVSVGPEF